MGWFENEKLICCHGIPVLKLVCARFCLKLLHPEAFSPTSGRDFVPIVWCPSSQAIQFFFLFLVNFIHFHYRKSTILAKQCVIQNLKAIYVGLQGLILDISNNLSECCGTGAIFLRWKNFWFLDITLPSIPKVEICCTPFFCLWR